MKRGFTLLEVLVAMTILGLAIVTLMQLSSQGLRLLRLSDDYQHAVLVADRLVRAAEVPQEGVETGREGAFQWERRVALVPVPEELTPGAGPQPRLLCALGGGAMGRQRARSSSRACARCAGSPEP